MKDNFGLKGVEAKRVAQITKEFVKHESRLPTYSELENLTQEEVDLPPQQVVEEAVSVDHPFKVITRIKPGTEETSRTPQAAVLVGTLLKSPKWDDRVVITGLAVPDTTTGELPDSSWFDLIANDAIWLEIAFPALTAEINSWGAGDEWADFTNMVEFSTGANPVQEKAYFPIAYTHADADGKPKLFQSLSSNLLLVPACHNSRACRYPTPYPLGAYLPAT